MNRILLFFNSLKLTLFLIASTAALSSLGTFLPQGEDNYAEIKSKYGEIAFERLHAVGLLDVYHSWWFLLVLTLFALNLIACTIVRLPKVWIAKSRPGGSTELAELNIPRTAFVKEFESALGPSEAREKARGILKAEAGELSETAGVLWAEKNLIALWGAYIVHAGLLMLLLAGSLRIIFGYSKYLYILEGERQYLPMDEVRFEWPLRFIRRPSHSTVTQVELDKFEVDYYKGTAMPSLFRSDVKILSEGKVLSSHSIKVNEPLDLGGVKLYQASYGYEGLNSAELEFRLPGHKDTFEVTGAPYKKRFKLLDSGWEAEITEFFPEADMAKPGEIKQTGVQLNNPAIRFKLYQGGRERAHFWHVLAYPSIQMSKVDGLMAKAKTVDPVAFSVFQVAHDPGIPFALAGALTVLTGVFCSFYLFYRRFWLKVEPKEGGGSRVSLTGLCRRNPLSFKRSFEKIGARLQKELA